MLEVAESERRRTVGPSSLVKLFLCDAFHAAGAARNAGANHYRARLVSSPRGWPANIEMHRQQFFAEFEFVPENSTMEHREIGRERNERNPCRPHLISRARITKSISQANFCTQAGWRQAACIQQQQRRRQSEWRSTGKYTHTAVASPSGRADGLWRVDTTHIRR